jgi:RNA polymerase sigma-70 factor (ECF subfamily)
MSDPLPSHAFHTTHWSLVNAACSGTPDAVAASLESLCRLYWPPLFSWVRQRGHSPHDAEDLTQEFFARLLSRDWLLRADPDRGRFRTFLLVAMKRFLANEWDRSNSLKRGGRTPIFSLDAAPDSLAALDPHPPADPDRDFDRRWALTVLSHVMDSLRLDHEASHRSSEFEILKPCLTADRANLDYATLAASLGITEASARSAVHRLRKRFRDAFRSAVAATVANPDDTDAEMHALITALASS